MQIQVENLEDLKKCGIYSITNTINGKQYIGSTAKSFRVRYNQHKSKLNVGKHCCKHLQSAYLKYGGQFFIFKIEEIVSDTSNIRNIEKQYIEKYDTVNSGYNENPDPNCSPMLNNTQQRKVSESLKKWWKTQKETLSEEEYKKLCLKHRGTKEPWNKNKKYTEAQKVNMRKPKKNGVSQKMKDVHFHNSELFKERQPYVLVYDINGNWLNTFRCVFDLVQYSKSEFNDLPIKGRKGTTKELDPSKIANAVSGNKPYKGLFFKRVPKDRKLSFANGVNSWKAEKPIMSQVESTLSKGAETTGELKCS